MRASILTYSSVAVVASILIAGCGSKPKQADDPTSENGTKTSTEETPKWEGATTPPKASDEPKPKAGGGVQEAPTRRTDQYDKEATEVVIKRAARQVKENCGAAKDDNGKATGPWGKATLQIQLGKNGHSKGVTVPAPFQGKPTGNCIEKAFTNLTFPPWGGSDTEVSWEVELVNQAEAAKK
jgi:hypothetical protein